MKKTTQKDRVLQYMKDFGKITTYQAFTDLGITRLSARIYDIIQDGIVIGKKMKSRKNRYGDTVSYMEDWIESE